MTPTLPLSLLLLLLLSTLLVPPSSSLTLLHSPLHSSHAPPPNVPHPENPTRIAAALSLVSSLPGVSVIDISATTAAGSSSLPLPTVLPLAALAAIHTPEHVSVLQSTVGGLTSDTYIAPTSFSAVLEAQSCWLRAAAAAAGGAGPAFAIARPPGHHATRGAGMGFCLANFAAAAAVAIAKEGGKVGVLDFDVHHGNGSEDVLKDEENVSYFSASLFGAFGRGDEASGHENVRKVCYKPGDDWVAIIEEGARWLAETRACQTVVVSAGYDALASDEMSTMDLVPRDFYDATRAVMKHFPKERIALGLEGGYDVKHGGLAEGVSRTAEALLGLPCGDDK